MNRLSVVIPVFNEVRTIVEVLDRIRMDRLWAAPETKRRDAA